MAKFQWFDGNQGLYGIDAFGLYVETARTATGLVLDFDLSQGALNPSVHAARIELTYSGYRTGVPDSNDPAGLLPVIAGNLTGVRYLATDGSVLLEVTRLIVPLPVFLATLARGDGAAAWSMMSQVTGSFVGSGDASGPANAGTGDVIRTGAGDDFIYANGGSDFLQDRGGSDHYYGGTGYDTVAYDGWYYTPWLVSSAVVADLVLGTATGPDGTVDFLAGIEALSGSYLADSFKGNAGANSFEGFAGGDTFDGRGGFDLVRYGRSAEQGAQWGVRVNLGTGNVRDGFGSIDRLISIEGVEGSGLNDRFIDNGLDNFLSGGGGDDVFRLTGGNDDVRGGTGADSFTFHGAGFGDDTMEDFSRAEGDMILIDSVTSFSQLQISTVVLNGKVAAFVECSAGSVTLLGLAASDLVAADFGL